MIYLSLQHKIPLGWKIPRPARPSKGGLIHLYYWLDMVKLFESFMRPNQELVAVKYFSARVEDDGKSLRQNAFFQANQLNPKFKLILGKYLRKKFKCKNCDFLNDTYEEKESDVRIATQILASRW